MEGFTDPPMRALQGESGAYSFCVSEFLRVSSTPLPPKVFRREIPELQRGGFTETGMPVQAQILGGEPELMALSALNAVKAGATAVDINFGCPAPTVNRHDGGATILQYPSRMLAIVKAVRDALPQPIPVSAKVRLGWEHSDEIGPIAAAVVEGGADWIVVHARTKLQKYRPPVYWQKVGEIRESLPIPVVANGDIWTLDDFRRCREATGCRHFMVGRGVLARPGLGESIAHELGLLEAVPEVPSWPDLVKRLSLYLHAQSTGRRSKTFHRLKQWLNLARQFGDFPHFDKLKRCATEDEFLEALDSCFEAGSVRRSIP